MKGVLSGDLGESMRLKSSVGSLVAEKLPVTLQLAVMAIVDRARHRHPGRHRLGGEEGHARGTTAPTCSRCGASQHAQLLARHPDDLPVLGDARLAAGLGLRAAGRGLAASLATTIMPAFVLGNALAAVLMRHTRSAMLQAMGTDYVRTARAKGLPSAASC